MPRMMTRPVILRRAFWLNRAATDSIATPLVHSYARFNLYFAPDICHLDFRPAHMASIDGLLQHPRAYRSQILPITSLFHAFSMMTYLIFQCITNSANRTSSSPRLRSSCSSIMQAISRFRSILVLATFSYTLFVLISYTLASI